MDSDVMKAAREAIDLLGGVEHARDYARGSTAAPNALMLAGIEAATQPRTESRGEAAWLIEQIGRPAWVGNPRGCHPRSGWVWTTAEQAIRFAREEDAYAVAFALKIEPSQFKVTEHLWMHPTQPAEAAPSDVEIEAFWERTEHEMTAQEAARWVQDGRALMRRNRQPADRAVEDLESLRKALGGYRDSDLASLATTLRAQAAASEQYAEERDDAREALRGLVEAYEAVEQAAYGGDLDVESILGARAKVDEALRAAKEVLR